MFMCGGKHEDEWLKRYFEEQMENNKKCELDRWVDHSCLKNAGGVHNHIVKQVVASSE